MYWFRRFGGASPSLLGVRPRWLRMKRRHFLLKKRATVVACARILSYSFEPLTQGQSHSQQRAAAHAFQICLFLCFSTDRLKISTPAHNSRFLSSSSREAQLGGGWCERKYYHSIQISMKNITFY